MISIIPSNLSCSATDVNVSGIAELNVHANQTAPIFSIHTATARRNSLRPPTRSIARSDIPSHRREAAAMKPQFRIGKPDVQNVPLLSDMHAAWCVVQDSTSHGICKKTCRLPGSNRPTSNYTGLTSSVFTL